MSANKSAPALLGPGPNPQSLRGFFFFFNCACSSSGARLFLASPTPDSRTPLGATSPNRGSSRVKGADTSAFAPRGRRTGRGVGRRPFWMGWWICRESGVERRLSVVGWRWVWRVADGECVHKEVEERALRKTGWVQEV